MRHLGLGGDKRLWPDIFHLLTAIHVGWLNFLSVRKVI